MCPSTTIGVPVSPENLYVQAEPIGDFKATEYAKRRFLTVSLLICVSGE